MKQVSLSGSVRSNVGKKDARAVRVAGHVPCVVYGSGAQTHFSVSHIEMEKLVYTPHVSIIELDIDGKKIKTIIQDIQFHPVTDKIWHVDFVELNDNKKVKVNIPVYLVGRSVGVMAGGKLQQIFRKVTVFALPADLPDSIEVDITKLKIGQAIRIKDLNNDKLNITNAANAVVCSIKMARGAAMVATEDEESTEEAETATEEAEA